MAKIMDMASALSVIDTPGRRVNMWNTRVLWCRISGIKERTMPNRIREATQEMPSLIFSSLPFSITPTAPTSGTSKAIRSSTELTV